MGKACALEKPELRHFKGLESASEIPTKLHSNTENDGISQNLGDRDNVKGMLNYSVDSEPDWAL